MTENAVPLDEHCERIVSAAVAEALKGRRVPTESDWAELGPLIEERRFRRKVRQEAGSLIAIAKAWLLAAAAIFGALAMLLPPLRAWLRGALQWLLG